MAPTLRWGFGRAAAYPNPARECRATRVGENIRGAKAKPVPRMAPTLRWGFGHGHAAPTLRWGFGQGHAAPTWRWGLGWGGVAAGIGGATCGACPLVRDVLAFADVGRGGGDFFRPP